MKHYLELLFWRTAFLLCAFGIAPMVLMFIFVGDKAMAWYFDKVMYPIEKRAEIFHYT